jgi:hypothetical protein
MCKSVNFIREYLLTLMQVNECDLDAAADLYLTVFPLDLEYAKAAIIETLGSLGNRETVADGKSESLVRCTVLNELIPRSVSEEGAF